MDRVPLNQTLGLGKVRNLTEPIREPIHQRTLVEFLPFSMPSSKVTIQLLEICLLARWAKTCCQGRKRDKKRSTKPCPRVAAAPCTIRMHINFLAGPQRHNPHRRDELRLFPGQRADLLSYGDDEDNDEDDRGHEADMDDTSIDSRASSMMGMADSIDSMNVG